MIRRQPRAQCTDTLFPYTTRCRSEGFRLDSSVRTLFDYRGQQGPDFYHLPLVPYWTVPERRLIELPLSTTLIGHLRSFGRPVYKLAQHFGNRKSTRLNSSN